MQEITGSSYAAAGSAIMVQSAWGGMLTMSVMRTEVNHAALGAARYARESLPGKHQRQKQRQSQIDDPARFHSCEHNIPIRVLHVNCVQSAYIRKLEDS